MKHSELPQHDSAVVVDLFPRKTVVVVEGVDTAQGEIDAPSGRRQAPPAATMRSANNDFNNDRLIGDVHALSVDLEVRKRLHQLFVKGPDPSDSRVVLTPRLIVIVRGLPKSIQDTFQVVSIFEANVLFDQGNSRSTPVPVDRFARQGSLVRSKFSQESACASGSNHLLLQLHR